MEKILLKEPYVEVSYDEGLLLGKVIWLGTPKKEEYRKPFECLLEFGSHTRVENFLSDTRRQGIISVEDRRWFEEEMVERSKKAGLKRAVVIISSNPFKKYYMNMILLVTNRFGIPTKVFTELEDGIGWIREEHQASY